MTVGQAAGSGRPPSSVSSAALLAVEGLSKHFGGTKALSDVDFSVESGEIHALLGENGAGKSTLIKLLAGIHWPDRGAIRGPAGAALAGQPLAGVAFVHQDLGLVDTISVAENIALGAGFSGFGPWIDWAATHRAAAEALEVVGMNVDPRTAVGRLASAEKSMVAIARALVVRARIVVLDEPTATLPQADVLRLHDALRHLRKRGLGIVYVTHRLDEVFEIADTVTVLRDGKVRYTGPVGECTAEDLVEHIIGRQLETMFPEMAQPDGTPLMTVEGLRSKFAGPVDFTLCRGEILGLVGLRASGQDTIGRLIAGALPARGGRVSIEGAPVAVSTTRSTIARGIGFVSSKRVEESLSMGLNLRENLFLDPNLADLTTINTASERERAARTLQTFGVRPPEPERLISTLSGGNQQKVVIARWLGIGRRVLILEEPTTGVDVGARAEIYRLLLEAVKEGMGVIIVSSDFEEVAGLCNRAIVFDKGSPVAELERADITVRNLARIAGGAVQ